MAYRWDENLNVIVFDFLMEDGSPGIQVIPMEVLANRMALLDLDDPGLALAALAAETSIGSTEPYAPVVAAIMSVPPVEVTAPAPAAAPAARSMFAQTSLTETIRSMTVEETPSSTLISPTVEAVATDDGVAATRAEAFAMLDMPAGPEPVAYAEFKDYIRADFGDRLQTMKSEFLADIAHHS